MLISTGAAIDVTSQIDIHKHKMGKLALTSATGKLGSAVLNAILDNKLVDTKDLIVCVRPPHHSPYPSL
jgi:hypothetical protein